MASPTEQCLLSLPCNDDEDYQMRSYEKHDEFASSVPTVKGLGIRPYRKYQGFWYPEHLLAPTIAMQDTFVARSSDILLATLPKSGTTWLKAIVFCLVNRTHHSPFDPTHPLLNSSPHDCFPFLHAIYENYKFVNPIALLDSMASPRLLAIHAPFSVLPSSVTESGCRIIYLCRDPKDAFISLRFFLEKKKPSGAEMTPFPEAFNKLSEGVSPFGPLWDHMLMYWKESLKRPEEVIFLKYEEMMDDTFKSLKKLADFLGYPFSEEEEKSGIVEEIVELCSIKKMKSVNANKTGKHGIGLATFENSSFFRKGTVGDWKEHMTVEMAQRLDAIVEQKLQGSGLTFLRK